MSVEIRAGAGTTRRVWLPMRATANGATREFSVSRGNLRTKRGEVNWCRVDCFCVADWKARIPPSGNFLNRGEEEWRSDRSVFAFARARYSKTCAVVRDVVCHGWEEDSTVSLTARNADLFPPGQVSNGGKGRAWHACCARAWRTKGIHRGFRGTRKAIPLPLPLPREEARLSVSSSPRQRAKRGGKWEHLRFPLE